MKYLNFKINYEIFKERERERERERDDLPMTWFLLDSYTND